MTLRVTTAGLAVSLVLMTCLPSGCSRRSEEGLKGPDPVVAEFSLGTITASDVRRFMSDSTPIPRWRPSVEPIQWYEAVIRRIAVDRLFLEEAERRGSGDSPQFLERERRIARDAAVNAYLDSIPMDEVTTEDLRLYFDARVSRFPRDEQRHVFTIFKGLEAEAEADAAVTELEDLRRRVLAGESFSELAREHSESETRHAGGFLGIIKRGQYSADFDRIVFALTENRPSEPITTAGGVHLFFVTSAIDGGSFAFDEVRELIRHEIRVVRRAKLLAEAAAEFPVPEPTVAPGPRVVAEIVRSGDPDAVLLRVGDIRLAVSEFRNYVFERRRQLTRNVGSDLPLRLLEETRYREIISHYLCRNGDFEASRQYERAAREAELISFAAGQSVVGLLERAPGVVREHFERNRMRFASPPRARFERLTVPGGENGQAVMARLQELRPELDAGRLDLEAVAAELRGEVRDLGVVTASGLQRVDARAVRFAFALAPGEHSPPYRVEDQIVMVKVLEKPEREPRPFHEVRPLVVQDYLNKHDARLYDQLTSSMLADAGFRLYFDRLDSIWGVEATAPGRP